MRKRESVGKLGRNVGGKEAKLASQEEQEEEKRNETRGKGLFEE